jgi:hypothetical protein
MFNSNDCQSNKSSEKADEQVEASSSDDSGSADDGQQIPSDGQPESDEGLLDFVQVP